MHGQPSREFGACTVPFEKNLGLLRLNSEIQCNEQFYFTHGNRSHIQLNTSQKQIHICMSGPDFFSICFCFSYNFFTLSFLFSFLPSPSLWQQFPTLGQDLCLYSKVMEFLSTYPYPLNTRRFIQSKFSRMTFEPVSKPTLKWIELSVLWTKNPTFELKQLHTECNSGLNAC